ncbi:MAG TPA: YbaK/EbsC family protein [bacterium]|nr:YbaK/EbsC family protein [bacterium]
MPTPPVKTEAVRALDELSIPYTLRRFKATARSAEEAARALGAPLAAIVKTLVLRGDRSGVLRVCVGGTKRLSLKKLAQASGNKRVDLVPAADLRRLTGYLRGGVSPLGGRTKHPVYCDVSVLHVPRVFVNGGMRGLQIELEAAALIRATGAIVVKVGEDV